MPFSLPGFPVVFVNTLNLDLKYSTLLRRFEINDDAVAGPASAAGAVVASPRRRLEILIARTNKVISCKTDRVGERNVFSTLLEEARNISREGDEAKIKLAPKILLGALFHRYFRIINECSSTNSFNPFSWFSAAPESLLKLPHKSDLFNAIRDTLQLPFDTSEGYLAGDLERLDTQTVVTSLAAFRAHMVSTEREDGPPKYKSYKHFEKDVNFLPYLDDIINEQIARTPIVLNEFRAIDFLESFARQLESDRLEMGRILDVLVREHPDFPTWSSEVLQAYLEEFVPPGLREQIKKCLEAGTELDALKKRSLDICGMILFGAYALFLKSEDTIGRDLKFYLKEALGSEVITDQEMVVGVEWLSTYIEMNPNLHLNFNPRPAPHLNPNLKLHYFDSLADLIALIERRRVDLEHEIAGEARVSMS